MSKSSNSFITSCFSQITSDRLLRAALFCIRSPIFAPCIFFQVTPWTLPGQIMLHFVIQFTFLFYMRLGGWRCRPVFLSLDCWICFSVYLPIFYALECMEIQTGLPLSGMLNMWCHNSSLLQRLQTWKLLKIYLFLLALPLQCMNLQKKLSLKIHQSDLAVPTHKRSEYSTDFRENSLPPSPYLEDMDGCWWGQGWRRGGNRRPERRNGGGGGRQKRGRVRYVRM